MAAATSTAAAEHPGFPARSRPFELEPLVGVAAGRRHALAVRVHRLLAGVRRIGSHPRRGRVHAGDGRLPEAGPPALPDLARGAACRPLPGLPQGRRTSTPFGGSTKFETRNSKAGTKPVTD